MSSGYWSREARRARLGEELFAYCEQVASSAPPPTPEQVALVGRAFRVAAQRIEAERRAGEQSPAPARAA